MTENVRERSRFGWGATETMRCPNCGNSNAFAERHCHACGIRLGAHRRRIVGLVAGAVIFALAALVVLT